MTRITLALSASLFLLAACGSEEEGEPTQDASTLQDAMSPSTVPPADAASNDTGVMARDASVTDTGSVTPVQDAGAKADTGPSPTPTDAGSDSGDAGRASDAGDAGVMPNEAGTNLPNFSFFVTSLNAMRMLSKNQNGFGGDLRFGETGDGAGLRGADKICAAAAELGMPGASAKQWRAFLSTSTVNAKDRIGQGPWYDRNGRLIAQNLTALLNTRPQGADSAIINDLPNERGEPNRAGSAEGSADDNHDIVTGSNVMGNWDNGNTCSDWTSTSSTGGMMGGPRVGHSWPAQSGQSWISTHRAPGCAPSVALVQTGPGSGTGIGNGGGYGGIYCFALTP